MRQRQRDRLGCNWQCPGLLALRPDNWGQRRVQGVVVCSRYSTEVEALFASIKQRKTGFAFWVDLLRAVLFRIGGYIKAARLVP
jgi:hypothetical protein